MVATVKELRKKVDAFAELLGSPIVYVRGIFVDASTLELAFLINQYYRVVWLNGSVRLGIQDPKGVLFIVRILQPFEVKLLEREIKS